MTLQRNHPFTTAIAAACLFAVPCFAALTPLQEAANKVVPHYSETVYAVYSDCLTGAKALRGAIRAFLAAPSGDALSVARKAWIKARQPYLQGEVFRYYAGPIDDGDGPEPLMNSWPLDELYVDAGEGGDGGIVGNEKKYPVIDVNVVQELNLQDGEKNISCGWHAIEFLLWGQDKNATGPGNRPFSDYTTAPFAVRRGQFLQACADLLVTNLEDLLQDWAPGKLGNYRAIFEEGYEQSLERIITGMIFLSGTELAGERLQVAWDTKEQEDEHSCFSDMTCQDVIFDAIGLQNIYRGRYVRTDGTSLSGPGLRSIVEIAKPELLPELDAKIEGTLAAARAIPVPFDQAILGEDDAPGRQAVLKTITDAEELSGLLRQLAQALLMEIPAEALSDVAG